MLQDIHEKFKIIIAGSQGVGKSSLLLRYVDNAFSQSTLSTIGVDFKFKTLSIDSRNIKLQIWDTAGSQAFKSIVSAYYRDADAVILVFDINSRNSFLDLKNFWIEEVSKYKEPECQLALLANKCDIKDRNVSGKEIQKLIKQENISVYGQTSAKTGRDVNQTFLKLTEKLLKKGHRKQSKNLLKMSVEGSQNAPKKGCCG